MTEAPEQAEKTINYTWTQTLQEVTVSVQLPAGTRGRDLFVEIKQNHLKAGLKGKPLLIDVYFVCILLWLIDGRRVSFFSVSK